MTIWKTISNKKGIEYSVKLILNAGRLSDKSNCSCRYGSFDRFTKKNRVDKFICRHMVKAYAEVLKISPMEAREILVKQGMNKNHIKIIK